MRKALKANGSAGMASLLLSYR